jgi:hypothetical protein
MAVKGRRKATNQRRVKFIYITEEELFAGGIAAAMERSVEDSLRWASCLRKREPGEVVDIGALGMYSPGLSANLAGTSIDREYPAGLEDLFDALLDSRSSAKSLLKSGLMDNLEPGEASRANQAAAEYRGRREQVGYEKGDQALQYKAIFEELHNSGKFRIRPAQFLLKGAGGLSQPDEVYFIGTRYVGVDEEAEKALWVYLDALPESIRKEVSQWYGLIKDEWKPDPSDLVPTPVNLQGE